MSVHVVINQKGGSGKTTLSTNLAQSLNEQGRKVLLIDADYVQRSALTWAGINEGEFFDVVGVEAAQLDSYLSRNRKRYDDIVIDCPPRADKDTGKLIRVADIVLIPVQPSPYDIWACADLVEIIKARKEATKDLPNTPAEGVPLTRFVVSRANKRTNIVEETREALAESGLQLLTAMTTEYIAYKESAKLGVTVYQTSNTDAISQIEAIRDEAQEILAQ